ncbi:MAG: hypothetical protein EP336_10290 [Rhodobacteraceae bacterium]|nr:MAG: hypothetical protein EP336_10290 [Paracoccaceae bacterium]
MNRLSALFLGTMLTLGGASGSLAQSIVGVAFVDGKRVDLYDNGTWDFSEQGDLTCQKIAAKLSFCGNPLKWKPARVPNAEVSAAFSMDDRNYGMVVYEAVGAKEGMSPALLQSVALEYAAEAAGVSVSHIPVYGIEPSEVSGHATETLYYGASFEGMNIIYANTPIVGDHDTAQLITYTLAEQIDDAFKARHMAFLDDFKANFWEASE